MLSEVPPLFPGKSNLVKKGATIELQEAILGLRQSVLSLKEENLTLQEANSSLQKTIQKREALKFEAPAYYLLLENGENDGPFCQVCQDKDQKLIRLKTKEVGSWSCGVCLGHFETSAHKALTNAKFQRHNNSPQGDWRV